MTIYSLDIVHFLSRTSLLFQPVCCSNNSLSYKFLSLSCKGLREPVNCWRSLHSYQLIAPETEPMSWSSAFPLYHREFTPRVAFSLKTSINFRDNQKILRKGGKNTQTNYTKKIYMTQSQLCDHLHSPRARHPGMWSQVGLRKPHYKQS